MDQAERLDYWKQVIGIMVDDAAYVFFGCVPAPAAKRLEVQDLEIVQSSVWDLHEAWMQE